MSNPNSLAESQQALLACLFGPAQGTPSFLATLPHAVQARGLQAYQSNGHLLAERVLQAAYPVVHQLLGSESFGGLARALWHAEPPHRGDMAQWGEALPAFVRASPQLHDEPYLHDVAACEWALHCATSAMDAQADLPSLSLLMSHEPDQLQLALAPGARVIASDWPVASILWAHNAGRDASAQEDPESAWPTLGQAGELLRTHQRQTALVWRRAYKPCVRLALPGEEHLVPALLQGHSLGQALLQAPALEFNRWLPLAVQSGLLLAVAPLDKSPTLFTS